jgi:thiamine-phosphate pyrophosphorylase
MTALPSPILVITDRRQCTETLEERAVALFAGGCRFLSLREKDMKPDERLALLRRLSALGRMFGATVAVHDDIQAAQSCEAALHLPADGNVAEARRILGPDALIGQSCHDRADMLAAAAGGADYVTMGPVFVSASKPGYAPAADLAAAIADIPVPVLALGGITLDTLPLLPAGFGGIAVMGAAMTAAAPQDWFARLQASPRLKADYEGEVGFS